MGCWRKLEYMKKTHTDMGWTCKLYIDTVASSRNWFFFVINIITKQDWMKQRYSRNFCTCFYLCIWCVQLPFSVLVGIWTWSKSWILSDHTCEDGREIRWQESSRFQTFEFNSWLLSLDLTGEKKKANKMWSHFSHYYIGIFKK